MYKICITNRHLVKGDFLEQIKKVALTDVNAIILREKDLSEEEYLDLAKKVIAICEKQGKKVILHSFWGVAIKLNHPFIHMPLDKFLEMENKSFFKEIGVSIHSVDEAMIAIKNNASYITASHIFRTDCKKGLEPRGLEFLREVTSLNITVYALGGINKDNIDKCIEAGADGVCLMSGYMMI